MSLERAFGSAIGTGSYGRVPAGSAATLIMAAKQTASGTTDAWAVTGSTCNFTCKVNPVPSVYNRPITVTLAGNPTGGSFTLTYNGYTTAAIASTATVATVQTALQAITSIGSGNATVTGFTGSPYVILLSSALAVGTNAVTATSTLTGGTTPSVVLS